MTRDYSLMTKSRRYLNAWSRYHHSSGFGIHSPFAYQFVRNVWRQRLPYYTYEGIHQLISTIKTSASRQRRREMDLISEAEARLLFRVTNFFNPSHVLQVGAATGVESVAMLAVNSQSHFFLYDPLLEQNALAVRVLQSQLDRVECYDDMTMAIEEFLAASGSGSRLALVNVPVDVAVLQQLLDSGTAMVLRRLRHDEAMAALFASCCDHMPMGQTYTNNKIAILNPNPKLQREDFLLWL